MPDLLPHFRWPAIARLANTLRRTMTVPIYPIAPEHTYREVFPFLLRLYHRILQTRNPNSVAFRGDPAGGGMAFALCHALRDAGLRYAGGDSLGTPLLSPSVGPLIGLPRLTIFTGTHDVLNPDARALRERAADEGLDIGWYERDRGLHV
ncbi:alpha/beta hydrolase fold domain-containing protein [Mycobacterium marinum]|uniref:alpha/beta hydrolase n=1 Tax=Mycobacterium marinum TaxID=1781 RepID=UPI0023401AFF|nr:alpha/beta hydrolase fold domain-containing protein [Mycobacterium marinum]MDC8995351.1 alpha/beta hydrolase fold domain-containing protein [Mycobacterium marinum]WDZ16397.1 alpha/beta hydrolase fold domain-containing protein [Mycobacterium marinum]